MSEKLFWVLLYRFWSSWKKTLIVVSPDTVVRWHRAGFRLYWQLISRLRKPVGRRPVTNEIRELIFKMVAEIPPGALRAFMANSLCSVLRSLSAASPAGFGALREPGTLRSVGLPSCAITAKPSQPWTSSQYRL
jgi:hypothetical protein